MECRPRATAATAMPGRLRAKPLQPHRGAELSAEAGRTAVDDEAMRCARTANVAPASSARLFRRGPSATRSPIRDQPRSERADDRRRPAWVEDASSNGNVDARGHRPRSLPRSSPRRSPVASRAPAGRSFSTPNHDGSCSSAEGDPRRSSLLHRRRVDDRRCDVRSVARHPLELQVADRTVLVRGRVSRAGRIAADRSSDPGSRSGAAVDPATRAGWCVHRAQTGSVAAARGACRPTASHASGVFLHRRS